jgi:Bacterial Ig-like domain (group 1)/PKD domain
MLTRQAAADGRRALLTGAVLAVAGLLGACDKVPLLAPTGTVITIFPAATTVPANGEVELVVTAIENGVASTPDTGTGGGTGPGTGTGTTTTSTAGSGTPVQNGTLISFTSTIGRIEPAEARTTNGQVRVRFIAGGQSGTATITAYSGGASGRLENLLVGSAAVDHVLLTATPQTLGPSGGTSEISARVEDVGGLPIVGVPVTFTSTTGTLSAASSVTDQNGVSRVTLTATRQAEITANVAGKTATVTVGLNPRTGIAITAPTTNVSAGQPATFTVNVSADANIRNVTVDWGDGASQGLGALSGSTTVSHTYLEAGTFTVRATATDASGFTESVSSSVTVLPAQPPGVTVLASNSQPTINETVILTATVTGATSTIIRYEWNFGPGATPQTAVTTGNRATASWASTGTKIITVRVFQATGPEAEGFGSVVVRQ